MTPRELLLSTTQKFRAAGIPDPETDGALLLSSLCGTAPLSLRLDTETILSEKILSDYEALTARRLQRIPLQYLLREAPFFGRMFSVDPRVLIPRPETEMLCEWALEILKEISFPRVMDLCCGSGCIGLTVKAERPDADVILSDISADALNVSRDNAVRLGVSVSFRQSDLLDGFSPALYDLIVSNPPYIPTEDCSNLQAEVQKEPMLALDGGKDGLDLYRRMIPEAKRFLLPGGALLMELGEKESEAVSLILSDSGYGKIEIRKDLNGIQRMILARND